jgi:integrase
MEKRTKVWLQDYGDRRWLLLQWLDPTTGKRKTRSTKTREKAEAEKMRRDLEYEINHGMHTEASRMSWVSFRRLFESEYLPGTRWNTQRNYRVALNLFEELCSPKTLRGISERTLSAFVAGLRLRPGCGKDQMAASSIKVRLQFLHTVLQWAVGQKLLPECPLFPSVKVDETDPEPVPVECVERLLERAPDQQMRVFLLTAWLAGLRLGEALALAWDETDEHPWIDFRRRRIVLPSRSVKGRKHQWIPLDPLLQAQLEALPRCGRKVFHFTDKRSGRPVGLVAVSHRVVALARQAGVKLTMKSLRRGFGCRYASKVPAQVLQRLLRHSNISVTMKYYANIDAAVEEAIFGNSGPQHTNLHITSPCPAEPGGGERMVKPDEGGACV